MRYVRAVQHFAVTVVREFLHDHGLLMAAALSFYATLSLIPLLFVGVSALGYVFGSEQAFHNVMEFTRYYAPVAVTEQVRDSLDGIVQTRRAIGSIGLVVLVWIALNVFVIVEAAMCITWRVKARPFWKSRPLALMMVLVVTSGLLVSLAFSAITFRFAAVHWVFLGIDLPEVPLLWDILGHAVPITISILLFTAVYWILPNTRVHVLAAAAGALFAGLLWQLALLSFRWYLRAYAGEHLLYGPLGGGLIVVLWIYYSMIVLLLGAQVAWQMDQTLRRREGLRAATPEDKLAAPAPLP
jgi:membrane protein